MKPPPYERRGASSLPLLSKRVVPKNRSDYEFPRHSCCSKLVSPGTPPQTFQPHVVVPARCGGPEMRIRRVFACFCIRPRGCRVCADIFSVGQLCACTFSFQISMNGSFRRVVVLFVHFLPNFPSLCNSWAYPRGIYPDHTP